VDEAEAQHAVAQRAAAAACGRARRGPAPEAAFDRDRVRAAAGGVSVEAAPPAAYAVPLAEAVL